MAVTPQKPNRLRNSAFAAALAISTIGGFEGLRQSAYPDPATRGKPWTICYGHTGPDVHPGERESLAQCKALLLQDLGSTARQVEECLKAPTPDARYVAVLSLAYNIGAAGACRSSVVRYLNEGNVTAGCNALLQYNTAKVAGIRIVMPGLTRRREKERELCMAKAA